MSKKRRPKIPQFCANCTLEILGVECGDNEQNTICFYCFAESQNASGDSIACPRCLGVGKRNIFFASEVARGFEDSVIRCEVCNGEKRIAKANVGTVILGPYTAEAELTSETLCPF